MATEFNFRFDDQKVEIIVWSKIALSLFEESRGQIINGQHWLKRGLFLLPEVFRHLIHFIAG
jgi:hypothetical protein